MSLEPIQRALGQLAKACDQLEQALATDSPNPLEVDGTIQRFEFTFELCWKALRRVLAWEGVPSRSPRSAIKSAYAGGLLVDKTLWLAMLNDRNLTSHVHDEAAARAIHGRIRGYAPALRAALDQMQERVPQA
jgi:nucleotidyltransferase substrate binding protein (TIGR01987 family)